MKPDPSPPCPIVEDDIRQIVSSPLPWERFAGKRVLVTGAGGFLGGYLLRTLAALNRGGRISKPVHVIAAVRNAARAKASLGSVLADPHVELFEWDFNSLATPPLEHVAFVLHAASQASPRFYATDPVGTMLPNLVGTAALLNVLQNSEEAEGFLLVSSSEVYGAAAGNGSIDEAGYGFLDPTQVRSCYGEAKRAAEALCVAWNAQFEVPTFIGRLFHTYGPGLKPDDGRVFADFLFNAVRGEDILIRSDGSARRAYCYVSDVVIGLFTVMLLGQPGTAYNVGNPADELSVAELAELLVSVSPHGRSRVRYEQADAALREGNAFAERVVPNIARLSQLGWAPRVRAADGLRRTIEALAATNA